MNKPASQKPVQHQIEEKIKLSDYIPDEIYPYQLDTSVEWVKKIFDELEEGLDDEDEWPEGDLTIELDLLRKVKKPFADQLIVNGAVSSHYHKPCVRCLIPTPQSLEFEFAIDFVPDRFENDEEYEEVDTVWENNQELDLYFHHKGIINLQEMLHEQVLMSIAPFPLHDENCKGLCPVCGTNLNTSQCKHKQTVE